MKITLDLPYGTISVGVFVTYKKPAAKATISTVSALMDARTTAMKLNENGQIELFKKEIST